MPIICRCPQVIDHRFSPDRLLTLILTSRHIRQIDSFLHPPPPCFPIKQTTVSLISNYLEAKRPILIYGDYDVDGITATALLWQGLYSRNPRVFPFIPHRHRDGYGFKADSFFKIQRQQQTTFDLLITVDNGIVAHREFKKLLNFQPDTKIVVIDHHLPSTKKLPVTSIIHSPEVSAAALAYFLAKNFHSQTDLGLAALGTVADCLPLLNLNRSLVYHGLRYLRLNPNPGLKLLIDLAGINRDRKSVV